MDHRPCGDQPARPHRQGPRRHHGRLGHAGHLLGEHGRAGGGRLPPHREDHRRGELQRGGLWSGAGQGARLRPDRRTVRGRVGASGDDRAVLRVELQRVAGPEDGLDDPFDHAEGGALFQRCGRVFRNARRDDSGRQVHRHVRRGDHGNQSGHHAGDLLHRQGLRAGRRRHVRLDDRRRTGCGIPRGQAGHGRTHLRHHRQPHPGCAQRAGGLCDRRPPTIQWAGCSFSGRPSRRGIRRPWTASIRDPFRRSHG